MTSNQHPDILHEMNHLEFTKRYMEVVTQTAESDKAKFMENMKEAFSDLDWVDSSASYTSLLTNARFFEMSSDELNQLKRAIRKPYFARIDLLREEGSMKEELYIGKTSLYSRENQEQIIVDWRSPIANLYYEGRIGKVEYESYEESFQGELTLKRQFMIEEGILNEIRDIDLTTTDELLQESLAKSSSNRLTEIISTIQEEQNQIIRADLNKPIIVQGAAGSGKTTIALHRISYFIYNYKEYFEPDQLMILAPSRLFIDYISEALPELGVEKVKQTTFPEFVELCLQKKVKLKEDRTLIDLVEKQNGQITINIMTTASKFKGSNLFRKILEQYILHIENEFKPKEDFYVDKYRLYSAKRMWKLFKEEYIYLPYYKRVDKIKAILQHTVKSKKKQMLNKVQKYYDDRIEKALTFGKESDKRRAYVSDALDKKAARLLEIDKSIRSSVNSYMKQFPRKSVFTYYQDLLSDAPLLVKLSNNELAKEVAEDISSYSQKLFNKNMYEREDLAALLYLQNCLFGIDKYYKAKNVVIDEAQDYTYLELFALKEALDTDMFTLVGDLAQGIHSYRGITDWQLIKNEIFPRATYSELQKSYRTTIEIMDVANELLNRLPYSFPEVVPVVRHGEKPKFTIYRNEMELVELLSKQISILKTEDFKTFAIIGKTMHDCIEIYKVFQYFGENVKLLKEQETIPKDQIVIVPSYLAKGLEFDVVFIVCLNESFEETSELDLKLLYVSMTRPLHRLYLYGRNSSDFVLDSL